jgi:outer membrane protein assembly factor BamB
MLICLLTATLFVSQTSVAADWPTFLGDNSRSGSTDQQIKLPLTERWVYSSPDRLRRAWSGPEGRTVEGKELHDRVKFDDALQVAVVGQSLYFGSSVDHQVHCIDTRTGRERWNFFTDAPIRLAPTVAEGRVFVGSDDGYVYCLDAKNGSQLWKLRLGPAEEWFLGRGEMISRWPVRTGILVEDGIVYFGAGIFPHENVYLCAADAASGDRLWRNDHISHEDAGRNDLSPQGYLLASADRLYIPNSRSRPKAVDRKTGKLIGTGGRSWKLSQAVTSIAGTDALIADGQLHTYSLGTRLAAAGEFSYALTGTHLVKMNRKGYDRANSQRGKIASELRTLSRDLRKPGDKKTELEKRQAELKEQQKALVDDGILWQSAYTDEASLIIASNLVFAGGEGQVTVFDSDSGKEVAKIPIDGIARGLAVASGKLFVSTTTGKISCFAEGGEQPGDSGTTPNLQAATNPYPNDKWTGMYEDAATQILEHAKLPFDEDTKKKSGFCLVIGSEQGRLAYELARRSDLKIYCVEPDERKVTASRDALAAAGIYGSQVTVHQSDVSSIPYSNYCANLIVSDTALLTGRVPGSPRQLVRHLKPAGGVLVLGRPKDAPVTTTASADLDEWKTLAMFNRPGAVGAFDGWSTLTRGTLPGAGNWSHQYGEPGNSASSGDKIVKGGLGVLWYGDPGPDMMVNRHQGAVGPLVVDGRMFVQGTDRLFAYDAYNGLFLWDHENPDAVRTGVFQNRMPGNLAVGGDSLFHMIKGKIIEHDVATGRVKATHGLPESVDAKTHDWGYVAVRDGLLFGTATVREVIERAKRRRGNPGTAATDTIFAVDIRTGEHLWDYPGQSIAHETIALGPGRVFFIDSTITSEQRAAILLENKDALKLLKGEERERAEERMKNKIDVRRAVALDARNGKVLWTKPVDVTDCSEVAIGGGKLTVMQSDGVIILSGANANGHYWKQFVAGDFKRRRLVALSAEDGYKMWAKDANYRHRPIIIGNRLIAEPWAFDLHTGEQEMRIHPLTGNSVPWSIMRPGHHCGMLTGSDNMLMFRSGFTGFYDLEADAGTRHFAGHRLGCWINAIPTNGLVVIPEASAGCVCMFSIASTIVMEPRKARRPWSLYSSTESTTPVKQMSLNFGAPGDRRDQQGQLWLAYPRPTPNSGLETSLDLKLKLDTQWLGKEDFYSDDGDESERSPEHLAWVRSSGAKGLKHCSIPLLGADDQPAIYTVRFHFSLSADETPSDFAVTVQGKTVLTRADLVAEIGTERQTVVRQIADILVKDNLVIELVSTNDKPGPSDLPVLNGIEAQRSQTP